MLQVHTCTLTIQTCQGWATHHDVADSRASGRQPNDRRPQKRPCGTWHCVASQTHKDTHTHTHVVRYRGQVHRLLYGSGCLAPVSATVHLRQSSVASRTLATRQAPFDRSCDPNAVLDNTSIVRAERQTYRLLCCGVGKRARRGSGSCSDRARASNVKCWPTMRPS